MRKLILRSLLSLGDIVMLTAAVRELHRCYPGQFLTELCTSYPELWRYNPYVTEFHENDPGVELIECEVPLVNESNYAPYHYIHAFTQFLNQRLGLQIRPTRFKGDIYISPLEKSWFSQVRELTGDEIPFWIVCAGGKFDVTVKWWEPERYQQVIDHFRGRIQFVQVGDAEHYHPKLDGVIDLRGQTDIRQLIRLVYHSQGVLCGVTGLMHLAAAIETKPPYPALRPCVVVAGGREPPHWEAYSHHQFIHTIGALKCCQNGGCWRDRTLPLGDGDPRDEPENLCLHPIGSVPKCMELITSEQVIERIETHFNGGAHSYLTADQNHMAAGAVELTRRNPVDDQPLTIHTVRMSLERAIGKLPPYPGESHGRGIVICGGGVENFTNAWVCIHMLRHLKCELPIELWHLGSREFDPEMERLISPLGVGCRDASLVRHRHPARILNGWELKPYALLHSKFQEVLLLDADNVPVLNPDFLFDIPEFKQTGAVFWPDFDRAEPAPNVWAFCGIPHKVEPPFESGQILVDKSVCWRALCLAMWFNENSDFFYNHFHGDKETFHLAFRKLDQPFAMPPFPIHRLKFTMCQHDFSGRRLFQHRNMDKWNLLIPNRRVRGFRFENLCRRFISQLQAVWDGRTNKFAPVTFDRDHPQVNGCLDSSELSITAWMISCEERTRLRKRTLRLLAATDWNCRTVHIAPDTSQIGARLLRITRVFEHAIAQAAESDAEFVIIMEDDLEFNGHLWRNLQFWKPLRCRWLDVGSLYNPGVVPLATSVQGNFLVADPKSIYGSQALIMSRSWIRHLREHWKTCDGPPDIRIPQLADAARRPIFYHVPSLAQHTGRKSTWGGRWHRANDFDPDWQVT